MITPSQQYRRLEFKAPGRLHKGLDGLVHDLIGTYQRRGGVYAELQRQAAQVEALAPKYVEMSDTSLHEALMEFRSVFQRASGVAESVLLPAMAAVREAADRKLGMRPFPVQVMGALALHRGMLAEMGTGEGKTLVAGLASVLAGWTRRPCHVVTVNDYLVERDSAWMTPLHHFCGVRVGFVIGEMDARARMRGYGGDVTYVTSKELLADFLRDRLRLGSNSTPSRHLLKHMLRVREAAQEGLVTRGLYHAIVDEADSILIDEAVTPLIISSPRPNELLQEAVRIAQGVASNLSRDQHYTINQRYKELELTDLGKKHLEESCADLPGLWRGVERRDELVRQALTARELFFRDRQYILEEGKVVIVDEFTGRPMPQRSWRQGLHQAIEAKEGLELSNPAETIARMSFQRFFRCFHHLAGMTGTAREAAAEFWRIYRLPVVSIPPNRPCIREHWPDRIFARADEKWSAVVQEIERLHAQGRPVLAGTRSVEASEKLARMLTARNLEFRVLNAIRHREEAATVSLAGEAGMITIATNMAGRGTDIKLGRGVVSLGGLHVLATERHESGRVDRQLFGRAARQGDPGSAQAFVSAEDELVRRFLPGSVGRTVGGALASGTPGGEPFAKVAFSLAQKKAQRLAYKARQAVLRGDNWLDESLAFAGLDAAPG